MHATKRTCFAITLIAFVVANFSSTFVQAQQEQYKAINPKEISCRLVDADIRGGASAQSYGPLTYTVSGGTIGRLECKPGSDPNAKAKDVPLVSKSFTVKNGIETKDFGVLLIEFDKSSGMKFALKAKPSQKEALLAFLAK